MTRGEEDELMKWTLFSSKSYTPWVAKVWLAGRWVKMPMQDIYRGQAYEHAMMVNVRYAQRKWG